MSDRTWTRTSGARRYDARNAASRVSGREGGRGERAGWGGGGEVRRFGRWRGRMDGVPNSGSSLSTKQKQPWIGTVGVQVGERGRDEIDLLGESDDELGLIAAGNRQRRLAEQRPGDPHLALVALRVDDPYPRCSDGDVVDVRARAGNATVMQNRDSVGSPLVSPGSVIAPRVRRGRRNVRHRSAADGLQSA